MAKQTEESKKAEEHLTRELGNQARQRPGSREEDEAKEHRAEAEREMENARDRKQQ